MGLCAYQEDTALPRIQGRLSETASGAMEPKPSAHLASCSCLEMRYVTLRISPSYEEFHGVK